MPRINKGATATATAPAPAAAPTKAAAKPAWICGFCGAAPMISSGAIALRSGYDPHSRCQGVAVNPNGTSIPCGCPCNEGRCRQCGRREVELTAESECVDVESCAEVIYHRAVQVDQRMAPLRRMLAEVGEHAAQVRAREAAAKKAREAASCGDEAPDGTGTPDSAPAAHSGPRRRTKGQPQPCHCGCGEVTKGGQFAMGHDMKLKGRLFQQARGTVRLEADGRTILRVQVDAAAEVIARGWNKTGTPAVVLEAAEQLLEAEGYDAVIERRVKERYSA